VSAKRIKGIIYLFIYLCYGLFNGTVVIWDCIAPEGKIS
jgi:hypothetical protein